MTRTALDPRPSPAEQRWFGVLLFVGFGVLGLLLGWRLESARPTQALTALGLAMALLYYAARPLRVPFFRAWMALTAPLGRLVSTVLLAVIYYLMLTPVALAMRALGRDKLGRRFDRAARSYWNEPDAGDDAGRYLRQS
jgi:hypothetical protein